MGIARTPTSRKVEDVKYYANGRYTVTMSNGDWVVLDDFIDTENLKSATLIQNNDGSALASSVTNNVVTVTGAASDVECTLFAYGVRA